MVTGDKLGSIIVVRENLTTGQFLNPDYYFVYTDHLGSIVAVTDDAGLVVHEQRYDAWGVKRDPQTWSTTGTIQPKPVWLLRGYTGHSLSRTCFGKEFDIHVACLFFATIPK